MGRRKTASNKSNQNYSIILNQRKFRQLGIMYMVTNCISGKSAIINFVSGGPLVDTGIPQIALFLEKS